jgi:alpha-D-xyloside xylohydrolase
MVAGKAEREVYLPKGDWFDFWTGLRHEGGNKLTVRAPLEQIPLYVKSGTVLPLADVTLHTDDPASGKLSVRVYGNVDGLATLYEEGGEQKPALTEIRVMWSGLGRTGSFQRNGPQREPRYRVSEWKELGER